MTSKQVLDDKGVKECVDRLVEQLSSSEVPPKNMVLVGVITRGVNLAERIAPALGRKTGVDVKTATLDTTPFRDDKKTESTEDRSDIPFSLTGKDVIIVDDVLSTGRTIRAAMDAILKRGRPRTIKTAVLINRGHRELPISADFVGAEIPTSVTEFIQVKLKEVDGKDGAYIMTQTQ
jgi:pyrimidine operon attenuation protein / uracil phosphoribosyltransferase